MSQKHTQNTSVDHQSELIISGATSADMHPALIYIASLAPGSRRTMTGALESMANFISNGRCNAITLNWPALRYQHTQALRAALAAKYAPATANKMLAALRGVLKESWRLGLLDAESYHRATDVKAIKASAHPRVFNDNYNFRLTT
jgi:hypothetical protein